MALPTYPVFDEYGEALLQQLGSFWMHYFGDRDKLKLLLRGVGHRSGQWYLDLVNTIASLSRLDVEVFRPEDWYLLVLTQSDRDSIKNVYDQAGLVYGGSEVYDGAQTAEILFTLPQGVDFFENLADIKFTAYNRVLYPSKTWVRGLDFDINTARNLLRFREDPFQSNLVARRDVYDDDGNLSDEEIGIWIYKGDFDVDEIYRRFGFAVGIQEKSSEFYKGLVTAFWDSYTLGSNMAAFEQAISTMLGAPLVLEATETVEVIRDESTRKLVITDEHVYEFSAEATIIVAVDDVLHAGAELADTVQIAELSGANPDYSFIPAMPLDSGFLSGGYFAALTFENQDVDIEYLGQDDDGKTVITFRVQGFPLDVEQFFEDIHTRGKLPGQQTLAELLDLRDDPVTQPLPGDLPAQLNPLEFVIENTMQNNLTMIKVKTSAIRADAPGLEIFRHFRRIVPPHTTFLVYIEITPGSDTMTLPDSVVEAVETFDGVIPAAEEAKPVAEAGATDASFEDRIVRVYRVSEVCK